MKHRTASNRLQAALSTVLVTAAMAGAGPLAHVVASTPSAAPSQSAVSSDGTEPSATASPIPQVGRAWQRVADRDLVSYPRNGSMHGVIAGGPGAIAWGYVYATGPRIWTSADGRDWEPADVEGPVDASAEYPGDVIDLAAGEPGFVAVGSYLTDRFESRALVWTSSDGVTWELLPDATAFDGTLVDRVVTRDGGFLVFGYEFVAMDEAGPQRIWASTDGRTWTDVVPVLPEGAERVSSVVPSSDRLWASSRSGQTACTAPPRSMVGPGPSRPCRWSGWWRRPTDCR